jgi:hypothetical protein
MPPISFPPARQIARAALRRLRQSCHALLLCTAVLSTHPAQAQDTVCARVKIEIKQELTLERQAFDAEMKISNQLDGASLTDVGVVVKVTDELGVPVLVSEDPNNLNAKFFLRVSSKENIAAVDGTGTVAASSTATIHWLLIPAPGSAGSSPLGKKYLIGATLQYKFGADAQTLDVSPDVITVKPLPLLTLDYFLQQDVIADDPLTAEIEPTEPFTLGVRVKNTGFAVAKNLKIDSAQPKIIENKQGLLINFRLTGSYLDDAPAQNTLLINFGEIAPATSKMGRWTMETTLAGKFTEFSAKFSHSDELGGALTSILQATTAHLLLRDVRVDLPGRDAIRDFLAKDGSADSDAIRVYESEGTDSPVTDRSAAAQVTAGVNAAGNASYRIVIPPTSGFVYVRLPDPFNGTKALGSLARADAKPLLAENVWLSKTRNLVAKRWEYWLNIFDVNTPGTYDTEFKAPPPPTQPPQLQFIPERTVKEEQQVSFLVEASSPESKPLTLGAAPLPAGARFLPQAADPSTPTLAQALFDWTPPRGSAGTYLVTYTASDGSKSGTRSASITVESNAPPPGPVTPQIVAPLSGAQVGRLKPTLSVQAGSQANDPGTQVQFEIYRDEALTQLVETATVTKAPAAEVPQPTEWQPGADLNDNTPYWWRARGFDGAQTYSPWVNARFFVNQFNDAPDSFNLTQPVPGAEVAQLQPGLSWTHSSDKDGDAITYSVQVYKDAALTDLVEQASDLPPQDGGSSTWTVTQSLTNHATYYWRAVARDALGAQTLTAARPFTVNTGNTAPTAPTLLAPGPQSTQPDTALSIAHSVDAESDLLTYVFEIDTVNSFDSADKRSSGQVIQSAAQSTSWTVHGLAENKRYWWRVKAQDGRTESAWVVGEFLMNAANDAPPAPTVKNPGHGAWVASLNPGLEANPVVDPEGEALRYQFEVFRDESLATKVAEGTSDSTTLIVPTALADKSTHWWHVRAVDAQGAASAWSEPAKVYVSTGPYQDPSIAVTAPATLITPDAVTTPAGVQKQVTIRWEGTDLNIEPTVALYYGSSNSGYAGTLIVDGLRQSAGTQTGSYQWDVSALAPGAYYVYAVIYDARGVGKAYAAGAVVIPNPAPQGSLVVTAAAQLTTSEDGGEASFNVRLARAPVADVTVLLNSSNGREGVVTPASLVFTPQNWSINQAAKVAGRNDCVVDGSRSYQVQLGPVRSLDPDYMGVGAAALSAVNTDNVDLNGTTNNASLSLCGLSIVRETQLSSTGWEYVLTTELTNAGVAVGGVSARLTQLPVAGVQWIDDTLVFGAVGSGETAKTADTLTLRSGSRISATTLRYGLSSMKWVVTVVP